MMILTSTTRRTATCASRSYTMMQGKGPGVRLFSGSSSSSSGGVSKAVVPPRQVVSKSEREMLRKARKERAAQTMEAEKSGESAATTVSTSLGTKKSILSDSRFVFGIGVGVPTLLLGWGIYDENSPPAKFSQLIGLTAQITSIADEYARPNYAKLLPDWADVSSFQLLQLLSLYFILLDNFFYSYSLIKLYFPLLICWFGLVAQCSKRYGTSTYLSH